MDILSAKSNEKIKSATSIRDSAKARKKEGLFFLEGARLCCDAAENGVEIVRAFFTQTAMDKYSDRCDAIVSRCKDCYGITDEIASKLSDTQSSQGVFCICKIPSKNSYELNPNGKYIMLENVQDPANLGAVSRTAEAIGVDSMIVCGGCDIYNPKALRASMGSALRLNIINCENPCEVLEKAKNCGMLTLASTPSTDSVPINEVDLSGGVVCVVGNEGNGITQETMSVCDKKVTIPMLGRAESLNASTAAAILIWEMMRK